MTNRINVLDHGFVELLNVMGDDAEPARAARISYGNLNERDWEDDAKLIKYLWDHQHTTPFEMVELQFRCKMPIFIARQWVRHRTANINEFSMRYADPTKISDDGQNIDYYVPSHWRISDNQNKQGSTLAFQDDLTTEAYKYACNQAIKTYHELQAAGVANEMARMVLPVSVYTEWVWKNDLHNILHFLKLRVDPHAQGEMTLYANAVLELTRQALPKLMEIVWPKE